MPSWHFTTHEISMPGLTSMPRTSSREEAVPSVSENRNAEACREHAVHLACRSAGVPASFDEEVVKFSRQDRVISRIDKVKLFFRRYGRCHRSYLSHQMRGLTVPERRPVCLRIRGRYRDPSILRIALVRARGCLRRSVRDPCGEVRNRSQGQPVQYAALSACFRTPGSAAS